MLLGLRVIVVDFALLLVFWVLRFAFLLLYI